MKRIMNLNPGLQNIDRVSSIPDIASDQGSFISSKLDKVGMENIEFPVMVETDGSVHTVPALIDVFVDLDDPKAKGIHMSRLYLKVQQGFESDQLSLELLKKILEECLESHDDISTSAYIKIHFDYMLKRSALLSDNSGWRSYPVLIKAQICNGEFKAEVGVDVVYSSTCPESVYQHSSGTGTVYQRRNF